MSGAGREMGGGGQGETAAMSQRKENLVY